MDCRCRQLESTVPPVLQLYIVPKRMKAKQRHSLVGGNLDGYAQTGNSAQQGARANAGICHAACYRRSVEMKPVKVNRIAARGAPAPGVAHL
jgi:hypothetical protein